MINESLRLFKNYFEIFKIFLNILFFFSKKLEIIETLYAIKIIV